MVPTRRRLAYLARDTRTAAKGLFWPDIPALTDPYRRVALCESEPHVNLLPA